MDCLFPPTTDKQTNEEANKQDNRGQLRRSEETIVDD